VNKKLLTSALALGMVISLTTLSVDSVKADNPAYTPIISRIAERFNLDETDVEAVFDAVHEERHDRLRTNHEERLQTAVEAGVIDQNQMEVLLDKWEEMYDQRQQEREELQTWFDEQGIDTNALAQYMGSGRFGPGHHIGR
jgi:hypothetical protein